MRIQLVKKHIDCTVIDCINTYAPLIGEVYYVWVRRGKFSPTLYERVEPTRNGERAKLRVVGDRVKYPWRYFDFSTEVELIPIGEEEAISGF